MRVRAPLVRESAGALERVDDGARFGERIEGGGERDFAGYVEALRRVFDGVLGLGRGLVPEMRAAEGDPGRRIVEFRGLRGR